jgi:glycerate-2-kinase
LFDAAVAAADPMKTIAAHLPAPPKGRVLVIGAGKASAEMARALEALWPAPLSGLVVTRYGHGAHTKGIEIVEASHPVPDQAGADAARRMMDLVKGLSPDDLVIALISGGGSALLPMPFGPLTLADKQAVNRALLRSGATITEMNCVRRHLSGIKGGRLLAACAPARVVTLAISDVPGDAPGDIASGPTMPDPTTCADALALIGKYGIDIPDSVRAVLTSGAGETPKPSDPSLPPHEFHLIAAPQASLEAAAAVAWRDASHPRRQPRGGIARRRHDHGRNRAPDHGTRPALRHALRAALWRRDDRHRARQG